MVAQPAPQIRSRLFPVRPLELGEELPVQSATAPRRAEDTLVLVGEAEVVRQEGPGKPVDQAVDVRESPVPVPGNRLPPNAVALLERRPTPLVGVTIPISDEEVHEAGTEVPGRIDPILRVALESVPEGVGVHDPTRSGKAGRTVWTLVGANLDPTEESPEVFEKLSERRVGWHHHEFGVGVENVGGFEKRRHDHRTEGEERTDVVLTNRGENACTEQRIEAKCHVLVDRSEVVPLAVGPHEAKRRRLEPPTALKRSQARGISPQVE